MIEIEVLNSDFNIHGVVDDYESVIWTDRFNTPGDFEIVAPGTKENINLFRIDYYLRRIGTHHMMIIEDITYIADPDSNGMQIQVKGRSLESILDRRVVWGKHTMNGNLQDEIDKLLTKNIINPTPDYLIARKIDNFVFIGSTDTQITDLTIENKYYDSESILEIMNSITEDYDIGWSILYNAYLKRFEFHLFAGEDRRYDHSQRPYVIFSPEYENVINSTYTVKTTARKNVYLVQGDYTGGEEDIPPFYIAVPEIGGPSGLNRREGYVKESNIDQDEMSLEQYEEEMYKFGMEELKKATIEKTFEGQYETNILYKYGIDFSIGDIVHVKDAFGNSITARVIEFIYSNNVSDGEQSYPTFRSI